jgi:hypothetical protein
VGGAGLEGGREGLGRGCKGGGGLGRGLVGPGTRAAYLPQRLVQQLETVRSAMKDCEGFVGHATDVQAVTVFVIGRPTNELHLSYIRSKVPKVFNIPGPITIPCTSIFWSM